jgi:hypothetical protein
MKRAILALLAGLIVWVVAISVLNRVLRLALAGYAAAEPAMSFTLGMLLSRLLIGALSSLLAGAIARWIAPASPRAPLLLGTLLLLAFIPVHLRLWRLFPLWYHLIFLGTLIPLVVLGSRLSRPRTMAEAPVRS